MPRRADLPTGTVTFLFSDIEGSTRLAQSLDPSVYGELLERHNATLRTAFGAHGGVERGTEGDAFLVIFTDASEAVAAAAEAQRALAAATWPDGANVRVRMGLHSGSGIAGGDDYVGIDVNRAARIAAAGSGGQVLVSDSTRALAASSLPADLSMRDLGEHRFKDLARPERVYQLVIRGLQADFPQIRSLDVRRGNLPQRLTSFIGRDAERMEVAELLASSRLVTITGPGGTGKTSLALAVAGDRIGDYRDGAWFVPLDAIADPELVPDAIVHALGLDIEDRRPAIDRLTDYLTDRRLLLVLDNFEHLRPAGALVHRLLLAVEGVSILVASQVPLHLGGEHEYPLGPLAVDDSSRHSDRDMPGPAVRLFVERAKEVLPSFEVDADNRDAIEALCARLDGLPLALELAAAQVRLLSPSAILGRLGSALGHMASHRSDAPERQRTLEAAVDWSYELLPDQGRVLLRHLAVFAGGARLAEIEELAAPLDSVPDALNQLGELVERSLVQRRRGPEDRFALLETIRAFAAARLIDHGEDAAAFRRHAEIFAAMAEEAEPGLYRSGRRAWLDRLSTENDNLRVALDRMTAAGELEIALRTFAALWRFWQLTGRLDEARARADQLLAAADRFGGTLDPMLLSRAFEAAGGIRYWQRVGDIAGIRNPYDMSLEHAQASGDTDRIAWATYNLSFGYDYVPAAVDNLEPQPERAKALREEALRLFREVGDKRGVAYTLWSMGGSPIAIADEPETLRERLVEALGLFREIDEAYGETWALMSLGMVEAVTGNLEAAREAVAGAARLFVRDGDLSGQIVVIDAIASMAARGGDPRLAVRIDAAGMAARRATGASSPAIPPLRGPIAAARQVLEAAEIELEENEGRLMSFDDILAEAIAEFSGVKQAFVDFGRDAGIDRYSMDGPSEPRDQ
jgi:predicted ATPase/class 3 adenylate cyclase